MIQPGMIISIPQLRICMRILDSQWDDIPTLQTDEPLEQRLVNAFLGLVGDGRLRPTGEGYEFDPEFLEKLRPVAKADTVWTIQEQDKILAFLYEDRDHMTILSPAPGHRDRCRLSVVYGTDPEQLLREATARSRMPETVRLCPKGPADRHDMDKMALFFDTGARTEDPT